MTEPLHLPDRRLRLAFLGTPELAATVLRSVLSTNEDDVVLVVCQPDRPKGRGQKVELPPVKEVAEAAGIPVIQPLKMKDGTLAARLREDRIDLAIVSAFGRILPPDVIDSVPLGFWNTHASLLPKFRGASPIQHAILEGETETGMTLMVITPGLDEGPMLLKKSISIGVKETQQQLTDRLAVLGAEVTIEGLRTAKKSGLLPVEQDASQMSLAPIIEKEAGRLDFQTHDAARLERQVRAFDPWPGAFFGIDGNVLRVLDSDAIPDQAEAGTITSVDGAIEIAARQGRLRVTRLQPAGKKPMSAADFLRGAGRKIKVGDRVS